MKALHGIAHYHPSTREEEGGGLKESVASLVHRMESCIIKFPCLQH